jgi:2-polyprenyl-3-methyl-5-hydroxy-6-metoxy-1,4-benzoquinol methylase
MSSLYKKWKRLFRRKKRKQKVERKLQHDPEQWGKVAQKGELDFHKKNDWRQTESFDNDSTVLFEYFGLDKETYRNKTIIDLGAGSKLRTKYFEEAKIIVIEPLADQFIKDISWCNLSTAHKVYSTPAEQLVSDCVGAADLVVSINVLDHCFDFEKIIDNIRDYLKPDGLAFLSFDSHDKIDEMHPLILDEAICNSVFTSKGLKINKFTTGFGDKKEIIAEGRDTYGPGTFCLNYWLQLADKNL